MATNFSLLRRVELHIRLFLFPHFIRRCPSWHCIFAIRIMACGHIVQGFMGFSLASGLLSHIVTSIFSCPRDHLRKWHRRVEFPLLSFLQPLSYTHKTVPSTVGAPHFSILKITSNGRLGLRFLMRMGTLCTACQTFLRYELSCNGPCVIDHRCYSRA